MLRIIAIRNVELGLGVEELQLVLIQAHLVLLVLFFKNYFVDKVSLYPHQNLHEEDIVIGEGHPLVRSRLNHIPQLQVAA